MIEVLNDLRKNSTLKLLKISNYHLGHIDSPPKSTKMAEIFKTNVTLHVLDLSCNPLGSKGVTWIVRALKSNKGVKKLYLMDTKCDDDGAKKTCKNFTQE